MGKVKYLTQVYNEQIKDLRLEALGKKKDFEDYVRVRVRDLRNVTSLLEDHKQFLLSVVDSVRDSESEVVNLRKEVEFVEGKLRTTKGSTVYIDPINSMISAVDRLVDRINRWPEDMVAKFGDLIDRIMNEIGKYREEMQTRREKTRQAITKYNGAIETIWKRKPLYKWMRWYRRFPRIKPLDLEVGIEDRMLEELQETTRRAKEKLTKPKKERGGRKHD